MKKVVITGATGFIGSELTKKLLLQGITVYGVGRNQKKLNELTQYGSFIPIVAELEQYHLLAELIQDQDFDMLWHFAWKGTSTPTYEDYYLQIQNIKTVCDTAEVAVKLRCKKICISSSYYQACNAREDSIKKSFNPIAYGAIKKCAINLFKAIAYKNNISCTNVIIPNVFGIGDKPNTAIVFFIKNMLANKPLNLIEGNDKDDWIYIDDLIDGIISASKLGKNCTDYYIGHSNITTFKEKLMEMKNLLSSESELLFGTYPEKYRVDYNKLDIDGLSRDTGFEPQIHFIEGIRKTVEWLQI